MSNMSYCRFQNTLQDLRDCYNHMESDNLSREEFEARKRMIKLCMEIIDEYGDLVDVEYKKEYVKEEF